MTTKDEALKLALEVIEAWDRGGNTNDYWRDRFDAITALREALAHAPTEREQQSAERVEPVAVYVGETWCGSVVRLYEDLPLETPLYTSPQPAQPSKPLTDELEALFTNIDHAISSGAWNVQNGSPTWEIIEEAKAAHGIKENT